MDVEIQHMYQLDSRKKFRWNKNNDELTVTLPVLTDFHNTVVFVEYTGVLTEKYDQLPITVSAKHTLNKLFSMTRQEKEQQTSNQSPTATILATESIPPS